jgi:Mn-dependent DtxR family transcriptional regulator
MRRSLVMHTYVKTLQKVADRYAPSRLLSFDMVHVFKTLQLIQENGHVSREKLCEDLGLGEGTIKTLVRHLKMQNLIESTNAGTTMTKKGNSFFSELLSSIPSEISLSKCAITLGKFNYAVLVKQMSSIIKDGIAQRDAAIRMGASGATTLLFKDNKFLIPQTKFDSLKDEHQLSEQMIKNLHPQDGDVIIIGSDNYSRMKAEFAAKSAALITIMNHEKH